MIDFSHTGRRFLTALAIFALLLLPFAPAASAAWPINGSCVQTEPSDFHGFGGRDVREELSTPKTAVSADLYVDSSRFQPCTGPILNETGGSSQWVSLTNDSTSHHEIVQVGMLKCNNENYGQYSDSACTTARVGKLVYFYAFGWDYYPECNSSSHAPRAIFAGYASSTPAYWTFRTIWRQDLGRVQFWIGGSKVGDISDTNICWLWSYPRPAHAGYWGERWDNNDGLGNDAGQPVHFDNTRYSTTTSGAPAWKISDETSCAAESLDDEFVCSWFASDHFGIETYQH